MNIKLTLLATVALALSFGAEGVLAFTTAHLIASRTSFHCYGGSSLKDFDSDGVLESTVNANRRNVLSKVAALLSMPTMFAFGLPAFADVSDGNALPEGAAQFSRVVRAKSDMIAVAKRVSQGGDEMDKTEWNNVGQFLRKVYGVGDDMKAIAGSFDSEKKKKAAALIDDLKKFSKAADAPTGSQNGPEFLSYAKKITSILDEFLDLMSDVPDEL